MSVIGGIGVVATLPWCHAGVTFRAWAGHLRRADPRQRARSSPDLGANLVPAVITRRIGVSAAAWISLPSAVAIIAVLVAFGLAPGPQMWPDDSPAAASPPLAPARIALAAAIGASVICGRRRHDPCTRPPQRRR
jgi:hypothetical protein